MMGTMIAIMVRRQPYALIYARGVTEHLKSIDAKYTSLIREKMEEQLLFDPGVETKNRKPMRQPAPLRGAVGDPLRSGKSLPGAVRY
jgi:hypothetical protein